MGEAKLSLISESAYLAGEELPGLRQEYVRGETFAMTGASKAHRTIVGNVFAVIRAHLRGTPCRTWAAGLSMDDIYEAATVPRTAKKDDS